LTEINSLDLLINENIKKRNEAMEEIENIFEMYQWQQMYLQLFTEECKVYMKCYQYSLIELYEENPEETMDIVYESLYPPHSE
jgi:hypothetical protein